MGIIEWSILVSCPIIIGIVLYLFPEPPSWWAPGNMRALKMMDLYHKINKEALEIFEKNSPLGTNPKENK